MGRTHSQMEGGGGVLVYPAHTSLCAWGALVPVDRLKPLSHRYNIVAQYYDAASLSFRDMVWHVANRNVS